MNDPVAALAEILNAELDVPVVGGSFTGTPPAVLVRAAGGGTLGSGYMPTIDARIDIRCWHDTDWEAMGLASQIARLLHQLRDRQTGHGRVRWCRVEGFMSQLREPDTGWHAVLFTWQVYGDWLSDD